MSEATFLYDLEDSEGEFWFAEVNGNALRLRWGRANYWFRDLFKGDANDTTEEFSSADDAVARLNELADEKRAAGFAELSELPPERVLARFATTVSELQEGGECTDDKYEMSYIGGRPRGLSKGDWPEVDGAPGLHVLSLAHVPGEDVEGLDLFASPSGQFVAIGRTYKDQNKKPRKPPANVPVAQPIDVFDEDTDQLELDTIVGEPFLEADPTFGDVVRSRIEASDQNSAVRSKLGGVPVGLDQDWPTTGDTPWRFVAQIDFSDFTTTHVDELLGFDLTNTVFFFVSPDYTQVRVLQRA